MIINSSKDIINRLILEKQNFIVCTYYIDSFSMLYASKLNQDLKKDSINIYFLEVEEFMKLFELHKRIFPIFCFFVKGELMLKTCGFINYNELIHKISKNTVLFS